VRGRLDQRGTTQERLGDGVRVDDVAIAGDPRLEHVESHLSS